MRLFFLITIVCLISIAVKAKDFETLEQEVIKFSQTQPEQAYEHFMRKIEDGASVPEQALYLYGMGIGIQFFSRQNLFFNVFDLQNAARNIFERFYLFLRQPVSMNTAHKIR